MAPLLACSQTYSLENPGIQIDWDTRSLAHFGEGRLHELLDDYDLVIFDHPYCGEIAEKGWFHNYRKHLSSDELAAFERDSLGRCWESYGSADGVWGLPIDAAAQVSCYRSDLLEPIAGRNTPRTLPEVIELAKHARNHGLWVAIPIVPIDAICTFLTLAANAGTPVSRDKSDFPSMEQCTLLLESMRELVEVCHPKSRSWNPIHCFDHMSAHSDVCYVPYAFGYSNYSRKNLSRYRLTFCDIPGFREESSSGAILGGAGIGISTKTSKVAEAMAFAKYICSPDTQSTTYYASGGQPASLAAWKDGTNDLDCGRFFSGTYRTLKESYLRPTFSGYIDHFRDAGEQISRYLKGDEDARQVAQWLIDDYYSR